MFTRQFDPEMGGVERDGVHKINMKREINGGFYTLYQRSATGGPRSVCGPRKVEPRIVLCTKYKLIRI